MTARDRAEGNMYAIVENPIDSTGFHMFLTVTFSEEYTFYHTDTYMAETYLILLK